MKFDLQTRVNAMSYQSRSLDKRSLKCGILNLVGIWKAGRHLSLGWCMDVVSYRRVPHLHVAVLDTLILASSGIDTSHNTPSNRFGY